MNLYGIFVLQNHKFHKAENRTKNCVNDASCYLIKTNIKQTNGGNLSDSSQAVKQNKTLVMFYLCVERSATCAYTTVRLHRGGSAARHR